jgi:hypothetical protein
VRAGLGAAVLGLVLARGLRLGSPHLGSTALFAYAFDMLLGWSRRGIYTLGFGPVPVVFSINLFLWFRPDWFYFQFLLVALGFAAKDLIRWDKDGACTSSIPRRSRSPSSGWR